MIRWIKRQWYKHDQYSPFYMSCYGKFKVIYNSGRESIPVDYKTAKVYAKIFGGKIIDNF